jgi:hypothetical protein
MLPTGCAACLLQAAVRIERALNVAILTKTGLLGLLTAVPNKL